MVSLGALTVSLVASHVRVVLAVLCAVIAGHSVFTTAVVVDDNNASLAIDVSYASTEDEARAFLGHIVHFPPVAGVTILAACKLAKLIIAAFYALLFFFPSLFTFGDGLAFVPPFRW